MGTIFKKELKQLFTGMIGCVFIAFILIIVGIYFTANNLKYMYPNFEYVLPGASVIYLLIVPVLTMRSMADETRLRTDQLLFTTPISMTEIVIGKFFAMATVLAIPTGTFLLYPLILSQFGKVNILTAYSSILAFFLLGCALIALGLFISTMTESQIIAAVVSFGCTFLFYMMNGITSLISESSAVSVLVFSAIVFLLFLLFRSMTKNAVISGVIACALEVILLTVYLSDKTLLATALIDVLSFFAAFDRLNGFVSNGLLDLTAIVYFISGAALFLFFSVQSLEKRRWN